MYTWGRHGTSRECQHAVLLLVNATRCGTHPIRFHVQVLTLKPCLICVLVFSLFSLICCFHTSLWRTLWPLLLSVGEEPPSSVMLEEASLYASSYPSYLQGHHSCQAMHDDFYVINTSDRLRLQGCFCHAKQQCAVHVWLSRLGRSHHTLHAACSKIQQRAAHLVPSGPSLSVTVVAEAFLGCSGTSRKSDAKRASCLRAVCVTTSKQKLSTTSQRLSGMSIQPNSVLKTHPEMPAANLQG